MLSNVRACYITLSNVRACFDLSFIHVARRINAVHVHVQDAVVQFLDHALVQAVKVYLRV